MARLNNKYLGGPNALNRRPREGGNDTAAIFLTCRLAVSEANPNKLACIIMLSVAVRASPPTYEFGAATRIPSANISSHKSPRRTPLMMRSHSAA